MGTKATYFKNISQVCDLISVISAILLFMSAAGGVVFVMVPAAVTAATSILISAITCFIYKRYEKANK